MREIVFDTETTGLSFAGGDRMVEIGCVELVNRVETGRHYHAYFNPERDMPEEAARVRYVSLLRLSPLLSISILSPPLHPSCAPPYIHAQHAKIADVRPAGGRLTGI